MHNSMTWGLNNSHMDTMNECGARRPEAVASMKARGFVM